jgi:hypothetical protein
LAAVEPTTEVAPPAELTAEAAPAVEPTAETPLTDVPTVEPTRTVSAEEILDDIDYAGEATPTREPTRAVSPEALLPSLTFAVGGGGGRGSCYGPVDQPLILFSEMTGPMNPPEVGLGSSIVIWGCGFTPLEIASAVFRRPDGTEESRMVNVKEDGEWAVEWRLLPGIPVGTYAFELSSAVGVYAIAFNVYAPTEPTLDTNCVNDGEMIAVLTGFAPGEEVLLGRYDLSLELLQGVLTGYEYATIGSDGTAVVTLPQSQWLVAVGQITGPVEFDSEYPSETEFIASAIRELHCVADWVLRY